MLALTLRAKKNWWCHAIDVKEILSTLVVGMWKRREKLDGGDGDRQLFSFILLRVDMALEEMQ